MTTTNTLRQSIHWEVWRGYRQGPPTTRVERGAEYNDPEVAREFARRYNEEERELAAMEQRTIRFKYVAVEALTERKALDA